MCAFVPAGIDKPYLRGGYIWREEYYGPSLRLAVWAAIKAKRRGVGCVKVEWR